MRITIGAPVTGADFFPRSDVIAALEQGLEVEHILFLAPRRTGKTSLLRHLENQPPAGAKAIFIDLERFTHPKQWIEQMVKELQKDNWLIQKMKKVEGLLNRIDFKSFKLTETDWTEEANAFLEALNRLDQRVLFLLDEFPIMINLFTRKHGGLEAENALRWFRCWRQENLGGQVRFLLTGSIGLDSVVRRLGFPDAINDLRRQELWPLQDAEAIALTRQLACDNCDLDAQLAADLAQEFLNLAGPAWPYFLQLFVAELQDANPRPTDTAAVKPLYDRIVFSKRNTYSENMWKRLNDVFSAPLAEVARAVLKRIADALDGVAREELKARTPDIESEDFNYVLDVLVYDGYLSETLDGRYRFFSNLLRDYWQRKGRL
jgi:hypothetical protein